MRRYLNDDQIRIEDALRVLAESLYDEVGAYMSTVEIFHNGDISAEIQIDAEGSVFRMEISNDGDRVVKEHVYLPDDGPLQTQRKGEEHV